MQYFRVPQEFYTIINQYDTVISYPKNIISYWKQNRDEWFSHKPICCVDMESTILNNYDNVNLLFSLVLQYDQLNRHPTKSISESCETCYKNINPSNTIYSNPVWNNIKYKFATHIAFKIIHNPSWFELDEITQSFTLLCIRHNKNLKLKMFALEKLHKLINNDFKNTGDFNGLYLRFLQATITDIQKYKYNQGFQNVGFGGICNDKPRNIYSIYDINNKDITDDYENYTDFLDIIDKDFIIKQTTKNSSNIKYYNHIFEDVKNKLERKLYKYYKSNTISKKPNFIISISGGVDSMLISYILADLRNNIRIPNIYGIPYDISCIHISYNNREECNRERLFLKWWCSNILKCGLIIRNIDEIKRNRHTTLRSIYETITRKIRFDMYKYMCNEYGNHKTHNTNRYHTSFIVLGHNKDDTYENIFTNLSKQIHFDNLFGMKEESEESNIQLWRPLLDTFKKNIYKSSMEKNIPYLIDSTPKWSQRGKLRDELMPMLNKFDPHILEGLDHFVKYSIQLNSQTHTLFKIWSNSIETNIINGNISSVCIKFDKDDTTDYFMTSYNSKQFWIDIWFHFNLDKRPSNKSINNIIMNINNILYNRVKSSCMKITIHKKAYMEVYHDKIVIQQYIK